MESAPWGWCARQICMMCVSRVCVMRGALSARMRDLERRFHQPWPVPLCVWRQKWRLRGEMCARLGKQTAKFISPFRITRAPEKIFALSLYNNTRSPFFHLGTQPVCSSSAMRCPRAQDFLTSNSLGLIRVCWTGLGAAPRGSGVLPKSLPRGASGIVVWWPNC